MTIDTILFIFAASFLHSVEFYVVCVVVAAAVVAMSVRPSGRKAVVTHLLAGELAPDEQGSRQRIELRVRPDGAVELTRYGVELVGLDGAVSAAVSVNAFDVTVEERLVPGSDGQGQTVKATFVLDFFGRERYHFRYNSEMTGRMAVATLAVKPDVVVERDLSR